jgi:hypothetical protein
MTPLTSSQEHHQTYRRRIGNNEPTDRDHQKGHRTHRTLPFLTPHPSPEPKQHPLHGQVGAEFQLLEETLLRLSKIRLRLALRKERSVDPRQIQAGRWTQLLSAGGLRWWSGASPSSLVVATVIALALVEWVLDPHNKTVKSSGSPKAARSRLRDYGNF